MVRRFLVEVYTPADSAIAEVEERARRAAAAISATDGRGHYVSPIFVPEDETCFYVLEAASGEAVSEAMRSAGIAPHRVTEVAQPSDEREEQQ